MNKPVYNDRTRRVKDILWFITFAGIIAMIFRFVYGLGQTTNLTDHVPWGLWKIFNMVAGAALATSGFTIGFLGHVLHLKQFQKLVKPAITVAFLGYGASLFALLFDIGLPWRFWHPFVHWNLHSFLFEVFWCVSIYFCITFLELSPVLLERLGLSKLQGKMKKAGGVFVIIGITLSSMHHTSLGSLFLVSPLRLHALWYSPMISLLFIISAIGGGMMVLLIVRFLYAWWYENESLQVLWNRKDDKGAFMYKSECPAKDNGHAFTVEAFDIKPLQALAQAAAIVLAIYFVLKMVDLFTHKEMLSALTAMTWESWLYIFEVGGGVLLPVLLIAIPTVRKSVAGLVSSAVLAAGGLLLNRMSTGIFGYFRDANEVYIPSMIEWVIAFGVLSMAGLAFFFLVENFNIFTDKRSITSQIIQASSPFDRLTRSWHSRLLAGTDRVSLIAMIIVPITFLVLYPPYHMDKPALVEAPRGFDTARDTLVIDGNRAGFKAVFAHAQHQKLLGGNESCAKCHHLTLPGDQATSCANCHKAMNYQSAIFSHENHIELVTKNKELRGIHPENMSCTECHREKMAKSVTSAKACMECHQTDMKPSDYPAMTQSFQYAGSYHTAMHSMCIGCHQEKSVELNKADLANCGTCHYGHSPAEFAEIDKDNTMLGQAVLK